MREILFRGKCRNEWFEGLLSRIQEQWYIKPNYSDTKKVAPETVGQYTGLTDKNGKKIFEGDIVEYKDERAAIQWDADTARYIVEFDSYLMDFDNLYDYEVEVIGNIYDNPKLLQDEVRT